jgi:excisionase family DNA binding protein
MPFHPHPPSRARRPRPEPTHTRPDTGTSPEGATTPVLYTPAEAAQLLKVRESWLRKKAAARQVPCTFLGKHLRFSPTDLAAIITAATQPAIGRRPRRRAPTVRDADLSQPPDQRVHPPDHDDHIRDGSSPWPG